MNKKRRVIIVCTATYRGIQIMESKGKFIVYLGAYRREFDTLPQATQFVDQRLKLKEN